MTFHFELTCDNAAFDPAGAEVARLLRDVAENVEYRANLETVELTLRDVNGNTCGRVFVTDAS